jgi:hypothetical protein
MGDRFVVVRADSNSTNSRVRWALKAISNTGRESEMRAELAAAVGSLIANASTDVRQLTPAETKQLTKLANIVTWTRTGVERDYKGEVVDQHALEMPTRFVKQLTQLVRGAMAIGMSSEAATRLAARCARDSILPLRRRILLDVATHPNSAPREVARRIVRPRMTVQRELLALCVLGVLISKEMDIMQGGRERTFVTYRLVPELDRKLLLSL